MKEKFPDKTVLLPVLYSLLFEIPLYKKIEYDDAHREVLSPFFLSKRAINFYCPYCNDISVFKFDTDSSNFYESSPRPPFVNIVFECSMSSLHKGYVYFSEIIDKEGEKIFYKVGQWPSLVDFQNQKMKKYRFILNNYYKEFTKAIKLNASGVGIGSFVYLRRIVEYLLEEAHGEALKDTDWDDGLYQKVNKTIDRISLLKKHLPKILVENKESYSILSKGIHDLGEDECLRYFPILKSMIELILDEKLAEKGRIKKETEVRKAIQGLHQDLKSR